MSDPADPTHPYFDERMKKIADALVEEHMATMTPRGSGCSRKHESKQDTLSHVLVERTGEMNDIGARYKKAKDEMDSLRRDFDKAKQRAEDAKNAHDWIVLKNFQEADK